MAIKYGDWQSMPDYREGWQDKNKSSVVGAIKALDLTTRVPGLKEISNKVHEGEDYIMTGANRVLEPILQAESAGAGQADPIRQTLSKVDPERHKMYQDWWNSHGADVAAIAAISYFTGGAAANALGPSAGAGAGSGAAAAAPAASGGAGAAGGTAGLGAAATSAITPTTFSALSGVGAGAGAGAAGSTTGALVGASSITPALVNAGAGIAGASGAGTLGTAGTLAATNAITPTLASIGAGQGSAGLSAINKVANAVKTGNQYRSNISKFVQPNNEKQRSYNQANALAQRIVNEEQPKNEKIKKISNQIMINRFRR